MRQQTWPLALACALAWLPIAQASVAPQPGATDPHIQSIAYEPGQVVALRVALGYATSIQFGADERIENVVVGNSSAWQVTPNRRGDHLFIKPTQAATTTNLEVITDSREYSFELQPAFAMAPELPFSLHFLYPQATVAIDPAAPAASYRFSGDRALWPSRISEEGQTTMMSWPEGHPIPAILALDDQGQESLVNGQAEEGGYRLAGIAPRYRFRLGKKDAEARRQPTGGER